ncbi:poly(3-hydroxybutyrate) depolymerase [Aureococcus anophagefferens]|nr:poly(3-hydroxybutyrate) depolymerase [Aureococcus anophagefferens]
MLLLVRRCTSSVTLRPPRATTFFKTRGTAKDFDKQEAGVYCGDAAAERYLGAVPGLNDWSRWHESPPALRNGHAHTIFAAKCRFTARVTYAREFIDTPDGGTLALDVVVGADEDDSPVTSPRFFSARRGSTDDVRAAGDRIRDTYGPSRLCAIGWSNSGTIVTNALAEQGDAAGLDAACCLAAPLDMPTSSANLEKPFHRNVYDRSIGGSLAEKVRGARDLFLDEAGRPTAVPAWGGGTFVADVDRAAAASTIRDVDEAITAPCFGFETVDAYYADASADQRVAAVAKPLLVVNAADDPIALFTTKRGVFDFDALAANPNVVAAVTAHGGHLGWCDAAAPCGPPSWLQENALYFSTPPLTPGPLAPLATAACPRP